MNLEDRINSFALLGETLREALSNPASANYDYFNTIVINQQTVNPWFTPENTRMALNAIAGELTHANLVEWTDKYPELHDKRHPVRTGVIMAGNIPLVGFHDYLSVLISGNELIAKTSSKDSQLIIGISEILCSINPEFEGRIKFTDGTLKDFDVVIATGSNNSSRYFEYYFGKFPNIIRKNRNSLAIIEGNESISELKALGTDIFSYFGLGCRNVSKIYLPECYDIASLLNIWDDSADIIKHTKYANNYDFNKAVYIVNKEKFHDTGYLLLKEDKALPSPVSVLHYEHYDSQSYIDQQTDQLKEKIQCIAGRNHTPFGRTQYPRLWDYADNIDTLEFLLKKNMAGIL
jgi:hypothetical protein